MKGIVFSELIEMVESELGFDVADRMIAGAKTTNDGAYTTVGTYHYDELIRLVASLSEVTAKPPEDLVRAFGQHLFSRLSALYPQFFEGVDSSLDFLPMVDGFVHVEVRKLYPDAELPRFDCQIIDGGLEMTYRSSRPFADLAEGMILACVAHFDDPLKVHREDVGEKNGTEARFTLSQVAIDGPIQIETCLS